MSAGDAGRHVVVFWDLRTDMFLKVENQKYNKILYLINCIAYALHLWYEI